MLTPAADATVARVGRRDGLETISEASLVTGVSRRSA
jgi:hypothetical protein